MPKLSFATDLVSKKLPTTLGGLDDRYAAVRDSQDEVKVLKAKLAAEEERVIEALQVQCKKQRTDGHKGRRYRYAASDGERATVTDLAKLVRHMFETKSYSLLQKRPGLGACQERWAQGETVPGIKRDTFPEFKAVKLPSKVAK